MCTLVFHSTYTECDIRHSIRTVYYKQTCRGSRFKLGFDRLKKTYSMYVILNPQSIGWFLICLVESSQFLTLKAITHPVRLFEFSWFAFCPLPHRHRSSSRAVDHNPSLRPSKPINPSNPSESTPEKPSILELSQLNFILHSSYLSLFLFPIISNLKSDILPLVVFHS